MGVDGPDEEGVLLLLEDIWTDVGVEGEEVDKGVEGVEDPGVLL